MEDKKFIQDAHDRSPNGIGSFTRSEVKDLYRRKMVSLSCIHPDTGEVIPWYARTSAFIPTNLPIIAAMSMTPPTPFNTMFWQWVN